jgi:hypothetical protein
MPTATERRPVEASELTDRQYRAFVAYLAASLAHSWLMQDPGLERIGAEDKDEAFRTLKRSESRFLEALSGVRRWYFDDQVWEMGRRGVRPVR